MNQTRHSGDLFKILLLGLGFSVLIYATLANAEPDRDHLRVAVPSNFPPQYMLDEQGHPQGFAVDVIKHVAKLSRQDIQFITYKNWPDVFYALKSGKVDLIPNIGMSDKRRAFFAYTVPVETFNISIFVRETTEDIENIADLNATRVATVSGNIAVRILEQYQEINTKVFNDIEHALFALMSAEVDALVYPEPWVRRLATTAGVNERIKVVGKPLQEVKRAMAVQKQNTKLLDKLNRSLNQYLKTQQYQDTYVKWYGQPQPYWTTVRVAWSIISVASAVIITIVVIMIWWKYQSTIKNNRQLSAIIKERKLAEAELAISENRWRSVSENSPDIIMTLDLDGVIQFVNRTLVGFSKEDIIGSNFIDYTPDKRDTIIDCFNKAKIGESCRYEAEYISPFSGQKLYFENRVSPITSTNEVIGFAISASDISERVHAENAMRESEQKFRAVFSQAADSIILIDISNGRFIDFNDQAHQSLGYTREEFSKLSVKDVEVLEKEADVESHIKKVSSMGKDTFETKHKTKTGEIKESFVTATIVEVSGKKFLVSMIRDITERKLAEEELQRNHQIFKFLARYNELTAGLSVDTIVQATLEFINDKLGINDSSIALLSNDQTGFFLKASFHPKEQQIQKGDFLPMDTTVLSEVIVSRKAMYRPDLISLSTNYPADKKLIGAGIKSDFLVPLYAEKKCLGTLNVARREIDAFASVDRQLITLLGPRLTQALQNGKLFEALQQSESQVRLLLESTGEAIYGVDMNGCCTFSNPACATSLGYDNPEQLLGKNMHNLIHHTYADGTNFPFQECNLYSALVNGEEFHSEEELFWRRDESSFPVEYSSYPILKGNEKIGAVVTFNDITQRRQNENELSRYREHLEELVAERTAALLASNKELEAFSYSVAHDLRTPLRSVTSFSQLLLADAKEKLTNDERDCLDRVVAAGKHMAQLIDDILQLAKTTRNELNIESINLSEMCQPIISRLQSDDPQRQVDWNIHEKVCVMGDRKALQIVMDNLLSNAWKFTQNVKLSNIEFGELNENNRQIFYIKDNGIGFDMTYATKLFTAFERLHKAGEFEGTGIGLATVRRIIERHGGEVWAKGSEDRGAAIFFTLPERNAKYNNTEKAALLGN